jgi:hypothetical protein
MGTQFRRPPNSHEPDGGPGVRLHRDASNFDFRVVTLMLVLITRADLLKEYLDGGKEKNERNIPLALTDANKWRTLRTLFDASMLADMLYLFELGQTQECAQHLFRVFQTMIHSDQYDQDLCPDPLFVRAIVDYSGQQTAELNQAGTYDDSDEE